MSRHSLHIHKYPIIHQWLDDWIVAWIDNFKNYKTCKYITIARCLKYRKITGSLFLNDTIVLKTILGVFFLNFVEYN